MYIRSIYISKKPQASTQIIKSPIVQIPEGQVEFSDPGQGQSANQINLNILVQGEHWLLNRSASAEKPFTGSCPTLRLRRPSLSKKEYVTVRYQV